VLSGMAGDVCGLAFAPDEATAGTRTCGRVNNMDGKNAAEELGEGNERFDTLRQGEFW
jgi:hypothetical protein